MLVSDQDNKFHILNSSFVISLIKGILTQFMINTWFLKMITCTLWIAIWICACLLMISSTLSDLKESFLRWQRGGGRGKGEGGAAATSVPVRQREL